MSRSNKETPHAVLSDEIIIELYCGRSEQAIIETDKKYKKYLWTIAYNILHDNLDCEECLDDTYLGVWNAIPPERPMSLQAFISKIMRNTALDRYKRNTADKRIPTEMTVSIAELGEGIPDFSSAEEDYFVGEVSKVISEYLRELPERGAFIFICRYYCSDKISDIADMLHVGERTVFRELTAIRDGLQKRLREEGYYND